MQRNSTHQKSLTPLLYIIFFIVYESLSSVYLFLPPLFGVLFVLFVYALNKEDVPSLFTILLCLLLFEADKGYTLFTSIIYFIIAYKFIMPKIIQNVSCNSCVKISYILLAYFGFFLFNVILSKLFLLPMPAINYYIVYYIVVEFLIVSLL
jgi:hypothetical protein